MFKVVFKTSIQKDLRSIPASYTQTILKKIQTLCSNPIPYNSTKLTGTDNLYRIRIGDYRVIYVVHPQTKLIVIQYIRHRREAYRDL